MRVDLAVTIGEIAEEIDLSDLASCFDMSEIAREIDESDLAEYLTVDMDDAVNAATGCDAFLGRLAAALIENEKFMGDMTDLLWRRAFSEVLGDDNYPLGPTPSR